MRSLNLGILAHVDAGKTSLTERLLLEAGVIDTLGSVDSGDTQTDSMALERARGITIKSAVVSFDVAGVTVNLIDTPGHPDFVAEVERVLSVLDGAVLVVSAVEGVQAQTRVLMRTLRRLRIPTLVFVNKIDRAGADPDRVFGELNARLAPSVRHGGGAVDPVLAEHDDEALAAYVDGVPLPAERRRAILAARTREAVVHPVFFGSAITGAGVAELMAGIPALLPTAPCDDGPLSGTVFKVERGPAGEKIAYARLFAGTLRVRDRVPLPGGHEGKVTALSVFGGGPAGPGRIVKMWGLNEVRIGDALGDAPAQTRGHFAPPTLATVVTPVRQRDRGALHAALTQLAEQDPMVNLRQDGDELSLSLYGEVQKEVIGSTLADEYGIAADFTETTTIHIERPVGTGSAVEFKQSAPFLATVGLRVEPGPVGSGVRFELGVELGSMPYAFFVAVEETVHRVLRAGLYGWAVTDVLVTMTHSGYYARQSHSHGTFDKSMSSTAGDFRNLTPLVLMSALAQAGTRVYEPMHRFTLEVLVEAYTAVMPVLTRFGAIPLASQQVGDGYVVEGEVPAAQVHGLTQRLPTLTRGEGVLESSFSHYRAVVGEVPERARRDHNPLNRREYLLYVVRRV